MVSLKKSVYPSIELVLRKKESKPGPLMSADCKELIGWTEEGTDDKWGSDFVFKDTFGKKIRLLANPTNRPFKRTLALRYTSEHLRGKWSLNLETIVLDSNGYVLQGQHRLTGFILAEQIRSLNPAKWGKNPFVYETALGLGVSPKPENANTYDMGPKRSLDDVIYRHQKFAKDVSDKDQKKISRILAGAIRLVWLRAGGQKISFAPHFPHSEALEFFKKHGKILDSVTDILGLELGDDNDRNISPLLSLGYAAGLHYLMMEIDRDKAQTFWEFFSSGEGLTKGSPILTLRQWLIKADAGTGPKRDEILGAIVNAWNLFAAGKNGSLKEVRVARKKIDDKFVLADFPRIGGIDSDVEVKVELTQHQLLILDALKGDKELTYKDLKQATGVSLAGLTNALMDETKAGKSNPYSLIQRKLVVAQQYEPEEGQKISPYFFSLRKKK